MIEKYSEKVVVLSFVSVISACNSFFFFILTHNFYYFTRKFVHLA